MLLGPGDISLKPNSHLSYAKFMLNILFQLHKTHWFILLFFKKMRLILMFPLCVYREINPIGKDTVSVSPLYTRLVLQYSACVCNGQWCVSRFQTGRLYHTAGKKLRYRANRTNRDKGYIWSILNLLCVFPVRTRGPLALKLKHLGTK